MSTYSTFRSEEMSLIQLFIQSESAHAAVSELGELGVVQFRDLNPEVNSFQRTYIGEVKRIDDMERRLRFITAQFEKAGIKAKPSNSVTTRVKQRREFDDIDEKLKDLEEDITQMNKNESSLAKNLLELTELRYVLRETESLFDDNFAPSSFQEATRGEETEMESLNKTVRLGFVTGVIKRDKRQIFERILWRSLRGNLFLKMAEITDPIIDPETQESIEKNVFIIFCQGEQTRNKIRKICESFGATLYPAPETREARKELALQVSQRIEDLTNVISRTKEHRERVLVVIAEESESWLVMMKKEKAVYHTMNMFSLDTTAKCLVAEGWCPTADIPRIREALDYATEQSQTNINSILTVMTTRQAPPTYHRTNKFTHGFQTIIDAYGIAKYREINPAPFSVITFPFLFAVMFGDFGHGILMTLAALTMVIYEKKLMHSKAGGEMFATIFGGRYIILLMGLFSTYTGLVYNDMFSKSLVIFGKSGWDFEPGPMNGTFNGEFNGHVYPFGVDPAWHGADNMLIFINSYKMKMSVIFGVMQMTFGIILSFFNHRYFKDYVSVIHEFIPQILFLHSIFGYLTVTIIFKWVSNWDNSPAPSLLTMLINMFLSPGNVDPNEILFPGQATVQVILLIIALVSVPWMLLAKPLILRHRANRTGYSTVMEDQEEEEGDNGHGDAHGGGHGGHGEGFDFGEVMVHQVIHTIEFCLGAISNTASYLRLWALSLAHAQLSDVLWKMTFGKVMTINNTIVFVVGMFGAFAIWFALTIAILLLMEGLSAFLHALRLHWVEFNGKFYAGSGYKFSPFSLNKLDEDED